MQEQFYLLTTLLELQDSVSDRHTLFFELEDAESAMALEVADCQENFDSDYGRLKLDLPRCKEWRTEDGFGYTVTIETICPV